VVVMMWMRWSLPRLRIDQVMMTCLQYFLPISCVLLVGVCLWQLLVPPGVAEVVNYAIAFGWMLLLLLVFVSVFRVRPGVSAPRGQLPGAWDGETMPVSADASAKRR
jgi:NADH-quinone oxidoreductase subunit H